MHKIPTYTCFSSLFLFLTIINHKDFFLLSTPSLGFFCIGVVWVNVDFWAEKKSEENCYELLGVFKQIRC